MKGSETSSFAMNGSVNVSRKPAQNVEEKSNSIFNFLYMSIVFAQLFNFLVPEFYIQVLAHLYVKCE